MRMGLLKDQTTTRKHNQGSGARCDDPQAHPRIVAATARRSLSVKASLPRRGVSGAAVSTARQGGRSHRYVSGGAVPREPIEPGGCFGCGCSGSASPIDIEEFTVLPPTALSVGGRGDRLSRTQVVGVSSPLGDERREEFADSQSASTVTKFGVALRRGVAEGCVGPLGYYLGRSEVRVGNPASVAPRVSSKTPWSPAYARRRGHIRASVSVGGRRPPLYVGAVPRVARVGRDSCASGSWVNGLAYRTPLTTNAVKPCRWPAGHNPNPKTTGECLGGASHVISHMQVIVPDRSPPASVEKPPRASGIAKEKG